MRYLLQVSSRALPGREADYNCWYERVHLRDVLSLPGFCSAKRFRRLTGEGVDSGEFVALYKVETDDPSALLESLIAASASMEMTDAIDLASVRFEFLQPLMAEQTSGED